MSHQSWKRGLHPLFFLRLCYSSTLLQRQGQILLPEHREKKKKRQACQQYFILRHLLCFDSFDSFDSFDLKLSAPDESQRPLRGLFVSIYCSFGQNTRRLVIVTPILTSVCLWITGADIVQWLIKNLSIEDPGNPTEKSVDTCEAHRQLQTLLLCHQLKPSTSGVWSRPTATSSPYLTTFWLWRMMEPFIAFRYRGVHRDRPWYLLGVWNNEMMGIYQWDVFTVWC